MREDYGIDMSEHRSSLLSMEDVEDAFKVIPIENSIGEYILHHFPGSKEKLKFLSQDIPDPWHAPIEVFRERAKQIDRLLEDIVMDLMIFKHV